MPKPREEDDDSIVDAEGGTESKDNTDWKIPYHLGGGKQVNRKKRAKIPARMSTGGRIDYKQCVQRQLNDEVQQLRASAQREVHDEVKLLRAAAQRQKIDEELEEVIDVEGKRRAKEKEKEHQSKVGKK